jgi:hypothetical protein
MQDRDPIFDNPQNQGILRCLRDIGCNWRGPRSCPPLEREDPYYYLGTHPDLVEQLWDNFTTSIPVDTRWVLHGRPVLVHPESKVIFAFANGTHTYAFRIPERVREEAVAASARQQYKYPDGSVFDLANYDEDWIFGGSIRDEDRLCLIAFRAAGDSHKSGEVQKITTT